MASLPKPCIVAPTQQSQAIGHTDQTVHLTSLTLLAPDVAKAAWDDVMKTFRNSVILLSSMMCAPIAASAEDGFYFGAAIGASSYDSTSDFGATDGNDLSLGGVVGHRWEQASGNSISVELSVDATTSDDFEGASYVGESCSDTSPDWCQVDAIVRLRGIYGVQMDSGTEVQFSLGVAAANGVAEDGLGVYADSTAHGFSLGIGAQMTTGQGDARVELIYDKLDETSPEAFNKSLEILSLRALWIF